MRINDSFEARGNPCLLSKSSRGRKRSPRCFARDDAGEEAAAYLDGAGRDEAKALPRAEALAYAAESMRLTTRLMQIASWLLLQRAVNQGEMTRSQASSDRHRVKLSHQEFASNPDVFQALPRKLRSCRSTPCACRRASFISIC